MSDTNANRSTDVYNRPPVKRQPDRPRSWNMTDDYLTVSEYSPASNNPSPIYNSKNKSKTKWWNKEDRRKSSGPSSNCSFSSDDEGLLGELKMEAKVSIYNRKKTSKSSAFELSDRVEMGLLLYPDQLLIKKRKSKDKSKTKHKHFLYHIWIREKVDDFVSRDNLKDMESATTILLGWHTVAMVIVFEKMEEKTQFTNLFNSLMRVCLNNLYRDRETSEVCTLTPGFCLSKTSESLSDGEQQKAENSQTMQISPYENVCGLIKKAYRIFNIEGSKSMLVRFETPDGNCVLNGCESPFSLVLYSIHQHNSDKVRYGKRKQAESDNASTNDVSAVGHDVTSDDVTVTSASFPIIFTLHLIDKCFSDCTKIKPSTRDLKNKRGSESSGSKLRNSKVFQWMSSSTTNLPRQVSLDQLDNSNKESAVVGADLQSLFPDGKVKKPITCLISYLWHKCAEIKGIFRQSGSETHKKAILCLLNQYDFESGENLNDLDNYSNYSVADALKAFLRKIPNCLLQSSLYHQWLDAVKQKDQACKLKTFSALIAKLNPQNNHLLHMLIMLFRHIASFEDINQMGAFNIATSISVSVLSLPMDQLSVSMSQEETVTEMTIINGIVQTMIENYNYLWPDKNDNESVFQDFCNHHNCGKEESSSVDSLDIDKFGSSLDRLHRSTSKTEHSPSSMSRDSGLHLSDQQLNFAQSMENLNIVTPHDDSSKVSSSVSSSSMTPVAPARPARKTKMAPTPPELRQPLPYDLALKRIQMNVSRNQNEQVGPVILRPKPPEVPVRRRRPVSIAAINRNQVESTPLPSRPIEVHIPREQLSPVPPATPPKSSSSSINFMRRNYKKRSVSESRYSVDDKKLATPEKKSNDERKSSATSILFKKLFTSSSNKDKDSNSLSPQKSDGRPSRSRSREVKGKSTTSVSSDDVLNSQNRSSRRLSKESYQRVPRERGLRGVRAMTKLPNQLQQRLENEQESYV